MLDPQAGDEVQPGGKLVLHLAEARDGVGVLAIGVDGVEGEDVEQVGDEGLLEPLARIVEADQPLHRTLVL